MGKGETAWTDSRARGDELLWMTDDELLDDGVGAACRRMHDVAGQLWGEISPGERLERASYQLARYPGGGAQYVRHTDVSEKCPNRFVCLPLELVSILGAAWCISCESENPRPLGFTWKNRPGSWV